MPRRHNHLLLKTGLILLCLGCLGPPLKAGNDVGPLKAKVLRNVDKAQVSKTSREAICRLLPAPCNTDSVALYVPQDSSNNYYVIINDTLLIARLERQEKDQWRLLDSWSFKSYTHSSPSHDTSGNPSPLTIYPALYPISDQDWAIAIISTYRESYSGGGGSFDIADFVPLSHGSTISNRIFSSVPFSCGKIVKACFTQNESKTSVHCSDDKDGYLTINFSNNPSSKNIFWKFIWHETTWPANAPKKSAKRIDTSFEMPSKITRDALVSLFDKISFCEGGPQDF